MGYQLEQAQWKCPQCDRVTVHSRTNRTCNHVAHLLASVFLCGLWLPVWFYDAFMEKQGQWKCVECGYVHPRKPKKIKPPKPPKPIPKLKLDDDELPRGEIIGGWGNLE